MSSVLSRIPILKVLLVSPADETFCVEDGVLGVHCGLVLRGIADQTLLRRKSDVGRSGPVALYTKLRRRPQALEIKYVRSLAMISTRSFCHTPTQLQVPRSPSRRGVKLLPLTHE